MSIQPPASAGVHARAHERQDRTAQHLQGSRYRPAGGKGDGVRHALSAVGLSGGTPPNWRGHLDGSLALQLPICFEVRALSGSLVSSTPE
jgi:hypothetical protein